MTCRRHGIALIAVVLLANFASTAMSSQHASEAARQAIRRIAKADPNVHAVITVNSVAVEDGRRIDKMRGARSMSGWTVLLKDNIDVRGLPTTAGSTALRMNVAAHDAPVAGDLRRAGAVILGKANMSEWAGFRGDHQVAGWSGMAGQTRNFYDASRTPGGSSSGSAVAVAAGLVDIAIGTDTGGSVITPSSYNGVVGFRPSVGRVSRTSIIPIATTFDTVGPITRTVRDAAIVMNAISGRDEADPASAAAPPAPDFVATLDVTALRGVRLGVLRFDAAAIPDDRDVFEHALAVLRSAGAILVDIREKGDVPDTEADELTVMTTEFKAGLNAYLAKAAAAVPTRTLAALIAYDDAHAATEMRLFGQQMFEQAEAAGPPNDPPYLQARERVRRDAGPAFVDRLYREARVSALVAPTLGPAPHIVKLPGETRTPPPLTARQANVAGDPQLTVPMGFVRGLPVGMTFIGPKWSDDQLLAYGYAYEQARGSLDVPGLIPPGPTGLRARP